MPAMERMESPSLRLLRWLAQLTAITAIVLGLLVIAGWYTQSRLLVQILPHFVPMQYNTALCFLICGLGLLFYSLGYPRIALISGVIVVIVATLTLLQYIAEADLGIDQLLMDHFIHTKTSHPGRMAPNTALCFVMIGMALSLSQYTRQAILSSILGSLVLGLAVVALLGYISGIETAYGWGQLTRMAVHTASGLLALGIGLAALAEFFGVHKQNKIQLWRPGISAFAIMVVTILLAKSIDNKNGLLIRQEMREDWKIAARVMQENVQDSVQAIERMAKRWEHEGGTPLAIWNADAQAHIEDQPGLIALGWLDASFHMRWREPANDEIIADHKSLQSGIRRHIEKSIDRRNVIVTPPLDLTYGKKGFLLYIPLFVQRQFNGFLIGVFEIEALFNSFLPEAAPDNFTFCLLSGDEEVYQESIAGSVPKQIWMEKLAVNFYGNVWHIQIQPTPSFLANKRSLLPQITVVLGLIFSCLAFLTIHFAQRSFYTAQMLKQRETALHDANAQKQAILDNVNYAIFTFDTAGIIQTYNKGAERMIGYQAQEVIGKQTPALWHDQEEMAVRAQQLSQELGREITGLDVFLAKLQTQELVEDEWTFVRKNGSSLLVWLSITATRGEEGDVNGYLSIAGDISERKKYEKQLMQKTLELERSNKELDEFAHIAAHDLKEPLRGISTTIRFFIEDYEAKLDVEGVDELNMVISLSKRMHTLISDLMYYARLGKGELAIQEVDVNKVVDEIREMSQAMLKEHNATIEIAERLPTITCDKRHISEILRNLIVNGVKYNDSDEKHVEIGYHEGVFHVKDNGIGIDEEFHQDIFRIFKRLHKQEQYGGGTGSGLTFVKKLVEQSSGQIWLESKQGQGTTFYFTL